MGQDIVFIPNVDLGTNRSNNYHYSVKAWQHWCDKNDKLLFEWNDLLYDNEEMKVTWQRWYLFDILKENGIELSDNDQVAIVDADTMIRPDAQDFFKLTNMKYAGVRDNGSYQWLNESILRYGKKFFNNELISLWEYMNNGLVVVNNKHKDFFKTITDYYWEHKKEIIKSYTEIMKSTDQTIVNYLRIRNNIDTKWLSEMFNLIALSRKELIPIHPSYPDTLFYLYMSGWIYHFNGIPRNPLQRKSNYFLKRTYEELWNKKRLI